MFENFSWNFDIKKEHINNKWEYVITAGLTDRWVLWRTDIIAKIFDEKTITIDMFWFAFYRPYKYKLVTHARVFWLKSKFKISDNQWLFLANAFHFLNNYFGYEKMCTWAKIKEEDIQLPTKNWKIDFDFMESFVEELEKEKMEILDKYLEENNFKDCELNEEEKIALEEFESGEVEWGEFRIEDVLDWQKQKEIYPLKLEKLEDKTENKYPFYWQSTTNNWVISYNQLNKDVLNNKNWNPTILIHSNNQNIVYLETPFYLKDWHWATSVLQNDKLNKINQMFFISSIDIVIKNKYSYNNKATKIELKNTIIQLPTKMVRLIMGRWRFWFLGWRNW